MNKISLVIQREYLIRVKNKRFILTTILMPLLIVGFIALSTLLAIKGKDNHKIAVVDNNGFFKGNIKDSKNLSFEFPEGVDTSNYLKKGYMDIILIPRFDAAEKMKYTIRSGKRLSFTTEDAISNHINAAIEDKMLQDAGINKLQLDSIHTQSKDAELKTVEESGDKAQESSSGLSYAIGFGSGMLIYITMFIYGAMVMRGVTEEKTNRIAEVMISSVKPFQLMMGKIIGTSLAGILQFIIWAILGLSAMLILSTMFGVHMGGVGVQGQAMQAAQNASPSEMQMYIKEFMNLPIATILISFIIYFIGGYFLYSSFYASIGAAVDNETDSQQFLLPIIMPLILGVYIGFFTVMNDPNGTVATVFSMIPLTSPIVMMMRIPFGVPLWQIILSMVILFSTFFGVVWFAAKIYRVGILMYGKKPTWKELIKWLRY